MARNRVSNLFLSYKVSIKHLEQKDLLFSVYSTLQKSFKSSAPFSAAFLKKDPSIFDPNFFYIRVYIKSSTYLEPFDLLHEHVSISGVAPNNTRLCLPFLGKMENSNYSIFRTQTVCLTRPNFITVETFLYDHTFVEDMIIGRDKNMEPNHSFLLDKGTLNLIKIHNPHFEQYNHSFVELNF